MHSLTLSPVSSGHVTARGLVTSVASIKATKGNTLDVTTCLPWTNRYLMLLKPKRHYQKMKSLYVRSPDSNQLTCTENSLYSNPNSQNLHKQYEKEQPNVTGQTKFNYAWGLVRSRSRAAQEKGVKMLHGTLGHLDHKVPRWQECVQSFMQSASI